MIPKIKTFANIGLQWYEIIVEVDESRALPTIEIIGLPDAAIRESKERIRATFRNIGIVLPKRKFIVNLSPSDIKKIGTSFDVPMALGILMLVGGAALHNIQDLETSLFFWELGLDWEVKRVNGLLPSVLSAMKQGYKHFFIPAENVYELEYIPDIVVYPIAKFKEIVDYFFENTPLPVREKEKHIETLSIAHHIESDFEYIKGQILAKRALAIAAAGGHNVIMVGAPWSGKTMLSKALQSILPPLEFEEILELSQIYSVVGKLNKETPLIIRRPFRQIHHTASKISITGGGANLTPWEVSLAHKGILFFDELTEFPREVLEVLRQPLEDRSVVISRVAGTITYPANFMFVAAMNPCKCGYYKDMEKHCICSINDIKKYQSKISGPLIDRVDMILEIPREKIDKILHTSKSDSSQKLREQVINAWNIQQQRFRGTSIFNNAQMSAQHIENYVPLDAQGKQYLVDAVQKLTLSPRVIHRTMKLARTIADMDGSEMVSLVHLAEAMQYRNKTMFIEPE